MISEVIWMLKWVCLVVIARLGRKLLGPCQSASIPEQMCAVIKACWESRRNMEEGRSKWRYYEGTIAPVWGCRKRKKRLCNTKSPCASRIGVAGKDAGHSIWLKAHEDDDMKVSFMRLARMSIVQGEVLLGYVDCMGTMKLNPGRKSEPCLSRSNIESLVTISCEDS
eukprot:1152952-Pelagomonas_calceolata.AAC.1